jgi:hypothetical protein
MTNHEQIERSMAEVQHQRKTSMNDHRTVIADADHELEALAAELTAAAYPVALLHGVGHRWLDLELELWRVLTEMVKKWGRGSLLCSEVTFVCDWSGRQSNAALGDGRDGLGPCGEARRPLSSK